MRKRTNAEIEQFFIELVKGVDGEGYSPDITVEVERGARGAELCIRVFRMYEPISLQFAHLKAVEGFFETGNFDINPTSAAGCESCDYGNEYGFELEIY